MATIPAQGYINVTQDCKACDHCSSVCPTGAITGYLGQKHWVNHRICINCGQCLIHCPFGKIEDFSMVDAVKKALNDPEKMVVVQEAPAVRVALGEEFGLPPGQNVMGKMYAALRQLGFDKVYDTVYAADLTIMEESAELINRLYGALGIEGYENTGPLPQFTSCCPSWIKFAEDRYPMIIPHLSTTKTPQQIFGAVAKTYLAQKLNINPANMYVVSVMPCTAKKYECNRSEFISSGYQDVDAVITTRELAVMIKEKGIDFLGLPAEKADSFIGATTGAGTIFGVSGGVMEAALRTAFEVLSGQSLGQVNFKAVRGKKPIREAAVDIPVQVLGKVVQARILIVTGTKYVGEVVEDVLAGRSPYHFIEVMNCPGGCVNGGGQPITKN